MDTVIQVGLCKGGYAPSPVTGHFEGILGWLEAGEVDGITEEFTYR